MEATIVSGQELNTDARIIRQLDDDFARMSNLVARNQLAANNATGQALQIQDLVNEKQAICEILRRIALLEEDFNTGRLEREGAAARERAKEILDAFYDLPGEYVRTVNQVFSRFAEVAGPSADVLVGNSLILDKFIRSLQIHFDRTSTIIEDVIIIGGAAIKFTVNGDRVTDDIDIEYASEGAFTQLLEMLEEIELIAATAKRNRRNTEREAVSMVVHAFSNKARMRRDAVEFDGRITKEAVFLLLKKYSVQRFGVRFAGPECLAVMKLRTAAGRDEIRDAKIRADINDVDTCLKHLLGEGKSLDDPQLLLLCTQEDVSRFIMLIQDKLPQYSEVIMRNMNMAKFPYMEPIEPAQLGVSPEKTPNCWHALRFYLRFCLGFCLGLD